jgi:squalene-hopene/tetraprenyl-beta-curcumene cyclase
MLKIEDKKIDTCIEGAQEYLLSRQHKDGYWIGLLEADVTVVTDFIPLMRIFGIRDQDREKKAIQYALRRQNEDGSWSLFYGGRGSLDAAIRTYFGLKLCGIPPHREYMKKAKRFILDNGGIEAANTYTKIILALFGQYSWKGIPEIPPEIIYLPRWSYINIYDFASWTRATIMAFSIILSLKPVYRLGEDEMILDLYRDQAHVKKPVAFKASGPGSLGNIFITLNTAFKMWDRLPDNLKVGRAAAMKKVEKWILEHQEDDGSWGGIILPWLFSLIALKYLGYENDHPVMKKGLSGLDDFIMEDSRDFVLQPATSPVWDTAWAIIALRNSGVAADDPSLAKAAGWLLEKQVLEEGDWKVKNPGSQPGGWSFEFENRFYPDVDDTAKVSLALDLVDTGRKRQKQEAMAKAMDWVIDMQNRDGSWAAFDRDNNKRLLRDIPFADFITPLDLGSPDITGHVLYVMGELDLAGRQNGRSISKALDYLKKSQRRDGSWYGRWGVTFIYGTSKVLQALEALYRKGYPLNGFKRPIERSLGWLKSIQNEDGGWGEDCRSFDTDSYCPLGESTASQTAWAMLGLIGTGNNHSEVKKAADYLARTQRVDGSWKEDHYTGGGFPGTFYLRYELYKDYFPLMALGKYRSER